MIAEKMSGGIYRKDLCVGCKRIIAQDSTIITSRSVPFRIIICPRCQKEVCEIAKVYESAIGWNPYPITEEVG